MSLRKRLRSSLVSSTTYFLFMAALLLGLNRPQDRTSRSEHQIIVDRGLEGSFSETRRRDCPTQSLCPEPELQKGSYCNKRRRRRTSTIMIRATITPLPSWNALRRSYLKLLLLLLRPIVFYFLSAPWR